MTAANPARSRRSRGAQPTELTADGESGPPPVSPNAGMPLSARVDALRTTLIESIEREVSNGNVRVILWLADRLRVLDAGKETEKKPAEELRAFFEQLDPEEMREFANLAGRSA